MSQIQKLWHRFAPVLGLLLTGIPLAILLAGQFISDNTTSTLVFILFLAAWTGIGTLFTRMSAKSFYWSLYIILWLVSLVLGLKTTAIYIWFPGWLAFFFPIGGSIFLATLYKPFMGHFAKKSAPKPAHPYTQPYEQGYRPTPPNPAVYSDESPAYSYSHLEQPQPNYPQDMMQQQ